MSVLPQMNLNIPCPEVLRKRIIPEDTVNLLSIRELCTRAGIPLRVSGADVDRPRILVSGEFPTAKARLSDGRWIQVISAEDIPADFPALRTMEILAYGFFDYAARECLCHRGFFGATG